MAKLSEWRLKMTENVTAVMSKLNGTVDQVAGKFTRFQDKLNGVGPVIKEGLGSLPVIGSSITAAFNPATLAIVGITAAVAGLASATTMAMNFETGMAKINATAQLTRPELDKLRAQLIDMGKNSTADINTIPDAFEKILSQVGEVPTSLSIMETALKGSRAGFTDVNVVAGALAQTLSIVGKENINAAEVMDTLFAAKRVGAGEFTDFANNLPGLIAAGKNLNLTFKDVAGMFAFMTGKGQSAADATMLLQNAFSALQKSEIVEGLSKAGVKVFDKDGSIRDIGTIFMELRNKLSGFTDEGKTNFLESIGLRDVQARNAFSILTSDVEKLNEALASTRDAVGETNNALELTKNPAGSIAEGMNKLKAIALEIGYKILPFIQKAFGWIVDAIVGVVDGIKAAYQESELLQDVAWAIGKVFEGIGWIIKKIGEVIKYYWENSIKPIFQAIEWAYKKIKELFLMSSPTGKILQVQKMLEDQQNAQIAKQEALKNALLAPIQNVQNLAAQMQGKGAGPKIGFSEGAVKKGVNSIAEGGKSVRNVTVNITKLVESLNISSATVKESATEMKRLIEEQLLRAIQGSELAMAND